MYGLRLRIQFNDRNGKLYYTNILERDYSGASVIRDVTGQPLSFQYGDGTVDDHLHVVGTVANIAFYTETPFELSDLYTPDKRKYKVVTRTDDPDTGTIIFQGWLTPQQYSEQIAYKSDVELAAVCGLGELGDIDYLQSDGTPYSGIKSYKQILVDILSKLELDIDIHIAVDFRATGVTGDPLAGQDIDVSIYEGLSCDDVLQQILPECRIMQRENGWWIESFNNLARASYMAYHYDYTGAAKATASSTITPGKNIDYDVLTVYDGAYERMDAYDKVVITQDYGKRDNLITNGDFTNGSTGWTPAGVTIDLRKYDDDKYYAYLRGGTQDVSDPDTLSHYITQTLYGLKATAGNKANLKFQYGLMGTDGHSAPMYIMLKLWGTTNTYYGVFVINPDGETYHIEFRTEAQIAPYPYITLQLGGTPAGYKNIDAKPYDEVADNLQSFDFDIDSLPEDGNLQIYLFAARTGDAAIAGPVYTDAKWNFKDGNADELPADIEVTGYNANVYIKVKDDVSLLQGTLPDYTNAGNQYKGGILKSATAGDLAASFEVDGSGLTYGYTELIARLMISRRNYPNFVFNGTIEGYMHPGEVLSDVRYPSAKLVFNGVTWDVANNEWQGAWVEVIPFESTATVNSNERVTNDSGTSVRASGSTKIRVFSNASTGTPVRINDLTNAADVTDDSRFEEDRPTYDESKYVTGAQLSDYINQKLGVTIDTANNRLIFTRSLLSEGYVGSQYAGGSTPTWMDMLPIASTAAKGIAQFDGSQFDVTAGVVTIQSGVLAPAQHTHPISDIVGLQSALDGKEPSLGNPAVNGYLLSSTTAGVRSWVAPYAHPTYTARNINAVSGQVIDTFTSNSQGHVTGISLRSLAAADIPTLSISKINTLQSALDAKLNTAGGTVSGTLTVSSLVVNGDIVQNGVAYETHAQQVYTANDLIITRDGAVAGLGAGEISGFKILKANGTNSLVFGGGNDAIARIGWEGGTLQAIATRQDSPTANGLAIWNNAASQFDTTLTPSVTTITVGGAQLSWDGSKMIIDQPVHVTGDFTASGRVGSQVASAISSSLWDLLPVTDPIAKDATNGNALYLKYGTGLKLDVNGKLIIDGDVFNLSNYYDKTTADGRFVYLSGNYGYLADHTTKIKAGDSDKLNGVDSSGYALATNIYSTDINTIFRPGLFRFNSNTPNLPDTRYYSAIVYGNGSNVTGQLLTDFVTGETYIRAFNTVWSNYRKVWDSENANKSTVNWAANNMNVAGQYQVNGTQISSSNLSDSSNIVRIDADNVYEGNNSFNNVVVGRLGDASGSLYLYRQTTAIPNPSSNSSLIGYDYTRGALQTMVNYNGTIRRFEFSQTGYFDSPAGYNINGSQISSSNLSDGGNLAKLDTSNVFQGSIYPLEGLSDANSISQAGAIDNGLYAVSFGATHLNYPTRYGSLLGFKLSTNGRHHRLAFQAGATEMFIQQMTEDYSTIKGWYQFYHSGNSNLATIDWTMRYAFINTIKLEQISTSINSTSVTALKVNASLVATGYSGSQASDIRVKSHVKKITPQEALKKVMLMNAYTYRREDLQGNPWEIGNIANEVEKVEPLLVNTIQHAGYDDFKTFSYERQSVLHGPAIQALYAKIQELEAEVKRLKNEKAA